MHRQVNAHTRRTIMLTHSFTHTHKLRFPIPFPYIVPFTVFGIRVGTSVRTLLCTLYAVPKHIYTNTMHACSTMASSAIHRCDARSIYVFIHCWRKSTYTFCMYIGVRHKQFARSTDDFPGFHAIYAECEGKMSHTRKSTPKIFPIHITENFCQRKLCRYRNMDLLTQQKCTSKSIYIDKLDGNEKITFFLTLCSPQ